LGFGAGLAVGPDFGMPPLEPDVELPPELSPPTTCSRRAHTAHLTVQSLEPQTLAVGLTDSPAGLLAWLLHRCATWSDNDREVLDSCDEDFLLTTFSLYWYTDCIASSMRRYHDVVFHPSAAVARPHTCGASRTGVTFSAADLLTGRSRGTGSPTTPISCARRATSAAATSRRPSVPTSP
jgi:hypothetical protein